MVAYTLLSIDEQGNAIILVEMDGKEFKQELCNIPVDDVNACRDALNKYASEYNEGYTGIIAEQKTPATPPATVSSLVGVRQEVI